MARQSSKAPAKRSPTERELLQELLEGVQELYGDEPHVYYQPPESVKMVYPCFIYKLDAVDEVYSSDKPYLYRDDFTVTYVTRDPEPEIVAGLKNLKQVGYDRHYTAENLHHYVFSFTGMLKWKPAKKDLDEIAKEFLGG